MFVLSMFDNDLMLSRILNHFDMSALSFFYYVFSVNILQFLHI